MLDRLIKQLQESGTHPHEWHIPNLSSRRGRSCPSDHYPPVPTPSIFKDVAIPYSLTNNNTAPPTFEQYPAPGHVAAHLLLIECFHNLREDVESSYKLSADFQTQNHSMRNTVSTWPSYLELAIKRFRLWATRVESVIRHAAVFNRFGTGSHLHGAFTEHYLPPIDVMLIWYSYLQSPAAYERLIASNDLKLLSQVCFPWHLIPTSVDQTTLEYNFPHAARTLWNNLVNIPPNLSDCIHHDFDNDTLAFTSDPFEMLEIALTQSHFIEEINRYKWLRSPSLYGTIQRAFSSYINSVINTPNREMEPTQQIPTNSLEPRNVHELDFDLPSQLVLHTHRACHSAWKIFTQLNDLKDEDMAPPPLYSESNDTGARHRLKAEDSKESGPCYCWICERVRYDSDAQADETTKFSVPLRQLSSPGDEKGTITPKSSSESGDSIIPLDLTKKQIKAIKVEVALYNHIENLRLKRLAKLVAMYHES